MNNRRMNTKLLKDLVHKEGVRRTADSAGLSVSTVDKLINGRYPSLLPKEQTRFKIATALRVNHDDLFPLNDSTKKNKAS